MKRILLLSILGLFLFAGCKKDSGNGGGESATEMYREPYIDMGGSPSAVKSYEERTLVDEDTEGDGLLLWYKGENSKINAVFYMFENLKLEGVICEIPTTQKTTLIDYLEEKYEYFGENNDIIFYVTKTGKKVYIGYNEGDGIADTGKKVIQVIYIPDPADPVSYMPIHAVTEAMKKLRR